MTWQILWDESQALAVLHFEQKRTARIHRQFVEAQKALATAEDRYHAAHRAAEEMSRPKNDR